MRAFDSSKHPRGQAANRGQFRAVPNDAPNGGLTPNNSVAAFLERKRQALLERGFVPATPGRSIAGSPRNAGRADEWWNEALMRAEVRLDGKDIPQMPDDNTPSQGQGRSLVGRRRTYRKLYQSGEIAVRMPSAAAIRRYSQEVGGATFDVPITAEGPAGNPISGYVRVTETRPGQWNVAPVNLPRGAEAKVAEAVNAVLEARRPTFALTDVEHAGGLLARARERRAASGVQLADIDSGWIRGAGYNDETGEVVLDLQGRRYAYEVPRGVYEYVMQAPSPGRAYNELIKGSYPSHPVTKCTRCDRSYREATPHACTAQRTDTGIVPIHNARVRAIVLRQPIPA